MLLQVPDEWRVPTRAVLAEAERAWRWLQGLALAQAQGWDADAVAALRGEAERVWPPGSRLARLLVAVSGPVRTWQREAAWRELDRLRLSELDLGPTSELRLHPIAAQRPPPPRPPGLARSKPAKQVPKA